MRRAIHSRYGGPVKVERGVLKGEALLCTVVYLVLTPSVLYLY